MLQKPAWLIIKEKILPLAETILEGSGPGVSVTKEGKQHLGAAIETEAFKEVCSTEAIQIKGCR